MTSGRSPSVVRTAGWTERYAYDRVGRPDGRLVTRNGQIEGAEEHYCYDLD